MSPQIKSTPSQGYFRNMNIGNLQSSLGCQAEEDQKHFFSSECNVLESNYTYYEHIFKSETCQKEAKESFKKN